MSARRTERLLNLTICLMAGRRPLSKSTIRGLIADYRDSTSDEAFERMFERDKDDLREMGIPLVTESIDPLFDDEVGYRIDPAAYALPDIEVGPDEMAVLTLAARAWQQAALAPAAIAALRKVEAYARDGGDTIEPDRLGLEPRVATSEVSFAPLYAAVRDRTPVRFAYRTAHSADSAKRRLEPWGVVSWHGRWYVAGHDRDRNATRVFRLSRIEGEVSVDGASGSVVVPDGVDPAAVVAMIAPEAPSREAQVRVTRDHGQGLRIAASAVNAVDPEHDLLTLEFGDEWAFAGDVIAANGVVVSPPELRVAVVAQLKAILAASSEKEPTS